MSTPAQASDALCRTLCAGNDVHRSLAAKALGRIAESGAAGALIARLGDEDEDVRADAAGALALLGDERAGATSRSPGTRPNCLPAAGTTGWTSRSKPLTPWLGSAPSRRYPTSSRR